MKTRRVWDDAKRVSNLAKHGLDFADAHWVLDSRHRLDIVADTASETRTQSMSYVMDCLRVLTVIHTAREGLTRIISYRRASTLERKAYHDWLDSE